METRDRRANLLFLAAALVSWFAVGVIVLTFDPTVNKVAGYVGAVAMGIAVGLTTIPVFWLVAFLRAGRIALRRGWRRAIRRGTWTGMIILLVVVLRLEALFQPQLALFIVAMVIVAETTMSLDR
ncbi:MAG: hypothetical protein ABI598_03150 [Chloroflexota bacterium]